MDDDRPPPTAQRQTRALRLLDELKNELTAAVLVISGIMLGTGFLLTWARLAREELPSQAILPALPNRYFVGVAIEATLAPLVIAALLGSIWVPVGARIARRDRRAEAVTAWAVFGALLGAISATTARWITEGSFGPPASGALVAMVGGSAAISVVGGLLVRRFLVPETVDTWWQLGRPVFAVSLVLCFAVPSTAQILNARYAGESLPFAQVIADIPCVELLNPRAARGGCQIGGFYLGASGEVTFIAQRRNPCPLHPPAEPPQLVMVPSSKVQALVTRGQAPKACTGAK